MASLLTSVVKIVRGPYSLTSPSAIAWTGRQCTPADRQVPAAAPPREGSGSAEHKRLEKRVPERPLRVEGLKQRAKCWQALVARLQRRRRDREQLAPMRARVERRKPLLD